MFGTEGPAEENKSEKQTQCITLIAFVRDIILRNRTKRNKSKLTLTYWDPRTESYWPCLCTDRRSPRPGRRKCKSFQRIIVNNQQNKAVTAQITHYVSLTKYH